MVFRGHASEFGPSRQARAAMATPDQRTFSPGRWSGRRLRDIWDSDGGGSDSRSPIAEAAGASHRGSLDRQYHEDSET